MKTVSLALAFLATTTFFSLAATSANAQGFGFYISSQPAYSTGYYSYSPRPAYYTSYRPNTVILDDQSDHAWHNSSHLHYKPAKVVQHGNHLHYVPPRYEVHQTGYWDHVHSDW